MVQFTTRFSEIYNKSYSTHKGKKNQTYLVSFVSETEPKLGRKVFSYIVCFVIILTYSS